MEAQTIFYPPLRFSTPLLLPLLRRFWSLFARAHVLLLSLVSFLFLARVAFSLPPRLFRTLRRYFFLADFLSRFLLTVLRRFPRKIMHS